MLLIIALIPAPLILLMLWIIVCELRGAPTFRESATPKDGQPDKIVRWIVGLVWLILVAIAYWQGGLVGVFAFVAFIAVLAAIVATFMTVAQSAKHNTTKGLEAMKEPASPSQREPAHQRFAKNYRRAIVDVPLFFASYG